ncbi:hypothetical protein [Staphylococcus nepalensis]|nr:hypothetical protein [Staphylococcus nepalensis]
MEILIKIIDIIVAIVSTFTDETSKYLAKLKEKRDIKKKRKK